MAQEAVKKCLDRFIQAVRARTAAVYGLAPRDIILLKDCPFHLEAPLDYQTIKIRCVIDKIAPEDIRLCAEFNLGRGQNFVRLIALKQRGEKGYNIFRVDDLVNGEGPHI